jgi:hypothetical protein
VVYQSWGNRSQGKGNVKGQGKIEIEGTTGTLMEGWRLLEMINTIKLLVMDIVGIHFDEILNIVRGECFHKNDVSVC